MNWLIKPYPLWENCYSLVRMFVGITLLYHGFEIFNAQQIADYGKWLKDLHFPVPVIMAYIGKGSEFVGGLLLVFGLFTRTACVLLILTFTGITFFIGHGKVLTEDQHPFLYVVLSLIYLFAGPGNLSLDNFFSRQK